MRDGERHGDKRDQVALEGHKEAAEAAKVAGADANICRPRHIRYDHTAREFEDRYFEARAVSQQATEAITQRQQKTNGQQRTKAPQHGTRIS